MTESIIIPDDLLPADGRFGSGPSKIREESMDALIESGKTYLGTSHRKPTVQNAIAELRESLGEFFQIPDGYEIAMANGGTTFFWDIAVHSLVSEQSEHLVFGEFSSRFSEFVAKADFLKDPIIVKSEMGTHPEVDVRPEVDTYAFIHNETSTGVFMDIDRPQGAANGALVLVDATSAAGGMAVDISECDAYYFAPQKCFGADGGTWFAVVSPAAIERAEKIREQRYIPTTLDFFEHLQNSRANTTYNTPSLVNVLLTTQTTKWMLERGGMEFSTRRCKEMSNKVYKWAEARDFATPFITDPEMRSPVSCTIDFAEDIDYTVLGKHLRANGIVDVEGYRKLGRNQLRIATFPAIEPEDIEKLLASIDYVVDRMRNNP